MGNKVVRFSLLVCSIFITQIEWYRSEVIWIYVVLFKNIKDLDWNGPRSFFGPGPRSYFTEAKDRRSRKRIECPSLVAYISYHDKNTFLYIYFYLYYFHAKQCRFYFLISIFIKQNTISICGGTQLSTSIRLIFFSLFIFS